MCNKSLEITICLTAVWTHCVTTQHLKITPFLKLAWGPAVLLLSILAAFPWLVVWVGFLGGEASKSRGTRRRCVFPHQNAPHELWYRCKWGGANVFLT